MLKIRSKQRQLISLEPNRVQRLFLEAIDYSPDKPLNGVREVVLKSRQFGMTTLVAGIYFVDTLKNPQTTSGILAHKKEDVQKIFFIVKRYWHNLPPFIRSKFGRVQMSEQQLYIPSIDSAFWVYTAGGKDTGRGSTLINVHGSEVDFWPDPSNIVSGLMNSVPTTGNIILESTANGAGGYFDRLYTKAKMNNSVFRANFYPWFLHDEYSQEKPFDDRELEELFASDEYLRVIYEKHNLRPDQIYWYYNKKNETPESAKTIKQEYPSNDVEAFLFSGSAVFDVERLHNMLGMMQDAPLTDPTKLPDLLRPVFRNFRLFSLPDSTKRYILGVDPAEGLNDEGDHDYSVVQVLDAENLEQAAVLQGRFEPVELARYVSALYSWYNEGLVIVERNNHGHAVLAALIHTHDIPHMSRKAWGGIYLHEEFDQMKRVRAMKPGYPMNVKSKTYLVDCLQEVLFDDSLILHDIETVSELLTYQKLPGGKMGALAGKHDDLVTSLGLAVVASKHRVVKKAEPIQPPVKVVEKRRRFGAWM